MKMEVFALTKTFPTASGFSAGASRTRVQCDGHAHLSLTELSATLITHSRAMRHSE